MGRRVGDGAGGGGHPPGGGGGGEAKSVGASTIFGGTFVAVLCAQAMWCWQHRRYMAGWVSCAS